MIQWQDWEVAEGVISRNQAGQFEARLTLRHENHLAFPGEYALSFVFDETGAKWSWQPAEPDFIADREENDD